MKDLKCFDKVIVGKPDVRPDSISTKYTLESRGKSVSPCFDANTKSRSTAQVFSDMHV